MSVAWVAVVAAVVLAFPSAAAAVGTPPVLTGVPTSPVVLEPWGPEGTYYYPSNGISATDWLGGWVPVNCAPSGLFQIGTTAVTCSASDAYGNTTTASFDVTVLQLPVSQITVVGGTVNPKTGIATINGTMNVTRDGVPWTGQVTIYGSIEQRIGRALITAGFGTMYTGEMLNYTGSTLTWSFPTGGSNGLFVAGNATVHAQANAGQGMSNTEATIKLKGQH